MKHPSCRGARRAWTMIAAALGLAALAAVSAGRPADAPLHLVFVYGSEKKAWLKDVTKAYLETKPTVNGRPVVVDLVPMGSGEAVEAVLAGEEVSNENDVNVGRADLISPASMAYLILGNARAKNKGDEPLVADADPKRLVRSPVVIAMWQQKAEALGWPAKPIGWKTLRELAANKQGWGSRDHPDWHAFKFGHTHPEQSNSGLIALLSQAYAAAGKTKDLTVADVESAATVAFLSDLERSVVHYDRSTGFFKDQMLAAGGDSFVHGAVLYENLVIESYDAPPGSLQDKVVAIYPEEGTFWSDHPVGVVNRPWVAKDPDKKPAADAYIDFLLAKEQQATAVKHGFRPGVIGLPIGAPIDKLHGVDPDKPAPADVLKPPEAEVMEACLDTWRTAKKKAHIVVVFDTSNDMNFGPQGACMFDTKKGAIEAINALAKGDTLSILTFNDTTEWLVKKVELTGKDEQKAQLKKTLDDSIECKGDRKLNDAIAEAYKLLQPDAGLETISAIVVLTKTTPNTTPQLSLEDLKAQFKKGAGPDDEKHVHVFSFAYGSLKEEGEKDLEELATATQGKAEVGDMKKLGPKKIRDLIKGFAYRF